MTGHHFARRGARYLIRGVFAVLDARRVYRDRSLP